MSFLRKRKRKIIRPIKNQFWRVIDSISYDKDVNDIYIEFDKSLSFIDLRNFFQKIINGNVKEIFTEDLHYQLEEYILDEDKEKLSLSILYHGKKIGSFEPLFYDNDLDIIHNIIYLRTNFVKISIDSDFTSYFNLLKINLEKIKINYFKIYFANFNDNTTDFIGFNIGLDKNGVSRIT